MTGSNPSTRRVHLCRAKSAFLLADCVLWPLDHHRRGGCARRKICWPLFGVRDSWATNKAGRPLTAPLFTPERPGPSRSPATRSASVSGGGGTRTPMGLRAPHFECSTPPQRRGHHRAQSVTYGHNLGEGRPAGLPRSTWCCLRVTAQLRHSPPPPALGPVRAIPLLSREKRWPRSPAASEPSRFPSFRVPSTT